ncbi:hypothetical protein [Neptunicella marina]|uniref:Uncharacterized protein n=1 Tax=Neptunicella marina TaxID=2125989 RepID=A0A8J6IVB8_9ALTE|nr:hypothetical protein [Neptunicella marina]MBC3767039.1 hypothetical protein [Neptunicella marina]
MDEQQKQQILDISWQLHAMVEQAYIDHRAKKGDDNWLDKQRLLLADMALHLLQTAIKPDDIALDKLTNNLNAILTISDDFLPHAGLKQATDKLYQL